MAKIFTQVQVKRIRDALAMGLTFYPRRAEEFCDSHEHLRALVREMSYTAGSPRCPWCGVEVLARTEHLASCLLLRPDVAAILDEKEEGGEPCQ